MKMTVISQRFGMILLSLPGLMVLMGSSSPTESQVSAKAVTPNLCQQGLSPLPPGPYSLFMFCDDASGTSIGVVYSSPGDPRSSKWSLSDRFWQEPSWCLDVTSFLWIPDGNRLAIATSGIYGTGSLYLLSLDDRESSILAQGETGQSMKLISYDRDSGTLRFSMDSEGKPIERSVRVPQ